MRVIVVKVILIISLLLILSSCEIIPDVNRPRAVKGYLDLSNWDLENDGIIALDGEWEFYWNQFLNSTDFEVKNILHVPEYINVPDTWDSVGEGDELRRQGFATYRLLLTLNSDNYGKLAFKFLDAATACKVWVNGIEVYLSGEIGSDIDSSVPGYSPGIAGFTVSAQNLEIIIQVSNFHHRLGGLWESISIGQENDIHQLTSLSRYMEIFLFSILFVFAFYHLILYSFNLNDKKILLLSFFSFFLFVRGISSGERLLLQVFPIISWNIYSRLEYVSFYIAIMLFMGILRVSFPKEINKTFTKIVIIFFITVTVFSLIFPVDVSSYTLIFVHIVAFVGGSYGLAGIIKAVFRKREGSVFFLTGFVIIFIFMINDILYARLLINSVYLSPLGFSLFILLQTFDLAYKISKSFELIKIQHTELNVYKGHLEDLVKERTFELEVALEAAEASSLAKSDFLASMSHELRTPLNHIIGFSEIILSKEELMNSDPEAKEFLNDVLSSGKHLLRLIGSILDLAKNKSGKQKLIISTIDLGVLLRESLDTFSIHHRELKFTLLPAYPESMDGDLLKIKQILYNLLSNAVKFSHGEGTISVKAEENLDGTIICVTDTGIGVKKEDQERIFTSFEQIETGSSKSYGGTGLGLALVLDFVTLHGGRVWVDSDGPGLGSSFCFFIPFRNN